jgi:uncharacterized protein (TIGR02099 family)
VRLIVHFTRTTWYAVLAGVIVAALLLSAARVLLPMAQEYRSYFETELGSYLGRPVSIGRLGARMQGLRPELVLRDVSVRDPGEGGSMLKFREMRLRLNMMRLISTGEFQPRSVSVVGAELSVTVEMDGSITIGGLEDEDEPPRWLSDDGRWELLDSHIQWQDLKRNGPRRDFSDVDVWIVNDDGRHQVRITLDLPAALGQSIDVRLDYRGDLFRPRDGSGALYVEGKAVRLGQLFKGESAYGYAIRQGTSHFRLWGHWRQARLTKLFGEIQLTRPEFARHTDGAPETANVFALKRLGGWFRWHQEEDHWQLAADRFALTVNGEPWPKSRFNVAVQTGAGSEGGRTRIAASYLRLGDVEELLLSFNLLSRSQRRDLKKVSPRGDLFDFRMIADSSGSGIDHFAACSDFTNIHVNAWRRVPGVNNLSGRICGNETEGRVTLTTSNAGLTVPSVFRRPLSIDLLEGRLHWRRQADGWRFSSDRLHLVAPDITADSRFQLVLPNSGAAPFLDLQTEFESERVATIRQYVPTPLLPKKLTGWLDRLVVSGKVDRGRALIYGPLDRFPFVDNDGVFLVLFDVQKLEAVCHRDWPSLKDVKAEFVFDNDHLTITSKGGRLLGASLLRAEIEVPSLTGAQVVHVTGSLQGDLKDGVDLLRQSPLRARLDRFLPFVALSGKHRIDLNMELPIRSKEEEVRIDGTVQVKQAQLRFLSRELSIDRIDGAIHFTHNGLDARGIKASIAGAPAEIDIVDESDSVAVRLSSRVEIDDLQAMAPGAFWRYLKGGTNYRIDARMAKQTSNKGASLRLALYSDLTGVEILLPSPIGKEASIARPFSLSFRLSDAGEIPVSLSYGEHLRAQLLFSERANRLALEKGTVVLGEDYPRLDQRDGLSIIAHMKNLHLEHWYGLLNPGGENKPEWLERVRRLDLQSPRVYLYEQDLGMVSLQLQRSESGWSGTLNNTYAKGRLRWPASQQNDSVLTLDLDSLSIPKFPDRIGGTDEKKASIDPRRLPDLNLTSQHLVWRGVDYGRLELITKRRSYGQQIDHLKLFSDNHRFTLSGHWKYTDFYDSTQITGEMVVEDVGLFLKGLGQSNVINETKGHFDFSLSWSAAPYRLTASHLEGDVNMLFGAGRLLTVEPGVGRALGMFNLDALKRMLLFDLSHLFGEGLAYDQVKGAIKLTDGSAKIERFVIEGVPVRIEIDGRIGLEDEKLDNVVTVTSKTGAPLGVAALLAQQLTANAVKGVARRKYSVTGSWDDPVITRLPVESGWLQKAWSGMTNSSEAD